MDSREPGTSSVASSAAQDPRPNTSNLGQTAPATSRGQDSVPAAPVLSLPKGGGAITGMGDKFDVNACTGTGSATLPINVSSARAGMQPQLSLSYDSGAGNGPFGLGWSLSGWGAITRKTSKGLPQYREAGSGADSDVFLLSGAEDLVPLFRRDAHNNVVLDSRGLPTYDETIQAGYMVRKYLPRIVQSFARIERWTNAADSSDVHWRILSAQNQTTIFGKDSLSRIYDPSSAHGGGPLRIFSWLEAETYDPYGNAVVFNYKAEDSANVPLLQENEANRLEIARTANRYLKSIQYGNTRPNRTADSWTPTSAASLPHDSWKFSVVFDYGEHDHDNPKPDDKGLWSCRLDPFSSYTAGFEVRTYRLCHRVLMFHHFEELNTKDCLVASTDITYNQNCTATYLVAGELVGYAVDSVGNPSTKKTLPHVAFEYSLFPTDDELKKLSVQELDPSSLQNLPVGLHGSDYRWVDLDGEGLSGILAVQGQAWYYKRNTSANNFECSDSSEDESETPPMPVRARFGQLETISPIPSHSAAGRHAKFGDVSGAGKLDLIQTSPGSWGYYQRDTEEKAGWNPYKAFPQFPNIDTSQPSVRFVDLTGDGLPDILIYADTLYCWYPSLAADGYGPRPLLTQFPNEDFGPVCVFSDAEQTIYIADMSGDGMADIVRIRNGEVGYWPNCGYGRFGSLISMDNAPWFDSTDVFNESRIRLTDIDGSGTTDILYLGAAGVDMYSNQSGNSFGSRKRLSSFPAIDDTATVDAIDLLGNGTNCLVWSSPMLWASQSPLRYIDFVGGKKPHLLTKSVNNLGTETHVHYAPSTKFYLQDKEDGIPWLTRLPFPVHCVEKVEVVDKISKTRFAKQYRYHDGYFDGVEREFRGFAMVEQWDTDSYAAMNKPGITNIDASWHVPPVHTKTWFHTGSFTDGNKISLHMAHQYFGAPPDENIQAMASFYKHLLPDTVFPTTPLETDVLREACRALKGHVLRAETYADDGSPRAEIPYSVQESNFTIQVIQPLQDAHRHTIFTVNTRESISYSYERTLDDPRVQHAMTLQVDPYGNILKTLQIAYGRRPGKSPLTGVDKAKQETTLFQYSENDVTHLLSTDSDYRLPTIYEGRTYEISGFQLPAGSSRFAFSDFAQDGFAALLSLPEIPFEKSNTPRLRQKRLIERHRSLYRRDDLSGLLPARDIQPLALPGASYTLCFTPGLINKVFKRQAAGEPAENLIPDPELLMGGTGDQQGGYVDLDNDSSWWQPGGEVFFHPDPAASAPQELASARSHFFQPQAYADAFGNRSIAKYDSYRLFPVSTVDPVGNITTVTMDYRVLSAKLVTDRNGNQSAVAFDALGEVVGTAVMGKIGENKGDSLANFNPDISQADIDAFFEEPLGSKALALLGTATSRVVTDVHRYQREPNKSLPSYGGVIMRESHASDPTPPGGLKIRVGFSYSDGFGRVIQAKDQAKPGLLVDGGPDVTNRWVGSGWTIYNNKGDPVRQYEPFFDDTHDFKFDMKIGVSPIIMYDPLSRVVATLQPDHSLDKIVFDPWSQTCYDRNDNVEISNPRHDPDIGHFFNYLPEFDYLPSWYDARIGGLLGPYEKAAAVKTKAHSNTPSVSHLDALKRAILVTEDNGAGKLFSTRVNFDIQGNALDTIDALGRIVAKFDFSVSGDTIHQASMEAGEKWELSDVLGNPFLIWNSRGFRFRTKYDSARRHTESWVRQGTSDEILYHQIVYGESATNAAVRNLRGIIYTIRDQAGEAVSNEFDFKGNLLSSGRQFAKNYKGILDWSHPVDLESTVSTVTTSYDALNRPLQSVAPDMSITNASYNESGILDKKFVNIRGEQSNPDPSTWTPIYTRVDCNAKSQLTNVYYGNGTVSSWTYDPLTYRLARLQTTRASATSIVQDLNYSYDPVGNITHVMDNAQQSIYFRNNRIDPSNDYTYDPVYRLVVATGREHLGQVSNARMVPCSAEINNGSSPTDGNAMGSYTESYLYDDVGNILSLNHAGDDPRNPGWTRTYSYNEQSQLEAAKTNNRLSSTTVGSNSERYTYDIHGNMTSMPQIPEMRWDFRDQLCSTSKQIVTNGRTSETTFYVYDAGKNRARKVTERQAGPGSAPTRLKETLYLAGLEKFVKYGGDGSTVVLDRETLHIDNDKCSVLAETTTRPGDTPSVSQLVRFQYSDSSGSVTLELDDTAQIITYEEYSPYGNTTYKAARNQAEAHKRYRYTKKERDTETGLYYYGARYYICWLGRWLSCDPGGLIDGPNIYQFALSNPSSLNDPTGQETGPDSKSTDKRVVGADGKFTGNESVEELHKRARAAGWDFTGTPVWNGHQWVCESAFLLESGASNDTGGKGADGNGASAKQEPKQTHPEESGGGPDPVLKSFAYGALVGFGTALVVGLAAGAALAVGGAVAIAVVSGIAVLGALALGITIGELITGEDLSGHKLTAEDKAFIVGGLVGGAIGGAVGGSAGQALGRGVRGLLSSRASQIPPTLLPPPAQPTPETPPPLETPQTPTDASEPGHTGKGFHGSKEYQLRGVKPEGAKRNSKLKVTRNTETVINGRQYSKHAQDDMQNRGVMPSVVENTIAHGKVVPGTSMDRVKYYEPDNDVFVILQGDEVRSTYFRDPKKPIP